jgi:hypothetical protein
MVRQLTIVHAIAILHSAIHARASTARTPRRAHTRRARTSLRRRVLPAALLVRANSSRGFPVRECDDPRTAAAAITAALHLNSRARVSPAVSERRRHVRVLGNRHAA